MTETALSLAQPLPFRVLLDEAMSRVRHHFRQVYLPVALPVAFAAGLMAVAQGLMSVHASGSDPTAALTSGGLFFLTFGALMVIWGLASGALLVAAVDAVAGRTISMARAWKTMFRPRVLGTLILTWLAYSLGFACCILPGIYLVLALSFVIPVMADEGVFGPAAIGRSQALAGHNPQRRLGADPRLQVFLVVFVGALIGYAVGMVIQLPVVVVQQVLLMRDVSAGKRPDPGELMAAMMWLNVPAQVLSWLAQTAVQLYVSFGLALLFFDVRHRKEGRDLDAAIDALAARGAPGAPA